MINANELRIGNWVLDENNNQVQCIGWLSGCIITFVDNVPVGKKDEKFSPIPLAPEILEKCGFVKQNYYINEVYGNANFKFKQHADKSYDIEIIGFTDQGINVSIYFLHQLQNIYYALTGEELTIKELKDA